MVFGVQLIFIAPFKRLSFNNYNNLPLLKNHRFKGYQCKTMPDIQEKFK